MQLDTIRQAAGKHQWGEVVGELYATLATALKKLDSTQDPGLMAHQLTLAVVDHFGGQRLYLPTHKHLKTQLRNAHIWQEFTGANINQLAKRYQLSYTRIMEIIEEQRTKHQQAH